MAFVRLLLACLFLPTTAAAQIGGPAQVEIRAEGYWDSSILGAFGVAVPAGTYARLGGVLAAGRYLNEPRRTALRADAVLRFHVDPFRQSRVAMYGAAGMSVRHDQDRSWRPYMIARVGIEGSTRSRWLPAVEAGLGGGAHLALVIRRARDRAR
jgi:hypothetical protein